MNDKDINNLKKTLLYFNEIDKEIEINNKKMSKLRKKRTELKDYIINEIKKNKLNGKFKLPNSTITFELKETSNSINKKNLKTSLDTFFTHYDSVNSLEKRLINSEKCYNFIISNLGKKKIESLIKKNE